GFSPQSIGSSLGGGDWCPSILVTQWASRRFSDNLSASPCMHIREPDISGCPSVGGKSRKKESDLWRKGKLGNRDISNFVLVRRMMGDVLHFHRTCPCRGHCIHNEYCFDNSCPEFFTRLCFVLRAGRFVCMYQSRRGLDFERTLRRGSTRGSGETILRKKMTKTYSFLAP
ncbi:hypothetical protein BC826DRAFT_1041060, partial [Russula brevipes]